MSPVIDKQQFENQSGGWIGAVVIGHKGDETGVAVEPGGTVWLSEAEQILTANAPRLPEDNPFLPKTTKVIDPQSGEWVEHTVTPLVPIQRDRFVPANDRPIPSDLEAAQAPGAAQVAATGDEPQTFAPSDPVGDREAAVRAAGDAAKPGVPLTPPKAAAAAQAAEEAAPTPESDEAAPPPSPASASSDATAAEATGAAEAPTGSPPTGEFQAQEEVGTPDAANAGTQVQPEEEQQPRPPAQQPAPWTPQDNIG